MNKEIKHDNRNTPEIQKLMSAWRKASGITPTDSFKYIIRKEYKSDNYYIEVITNRPGYLIGPQGTRIKGFTEKFKELGIERIDILDTYKIHTVYNEENEEMYYGKL